MSHPDINLSTINKYIVITIRDLFITISILKINNDNNYKILYIFDDVIKLFLIV